jgi:hypothetical protein
VAKTWLHNCTSRHSECQQRVTRKLPKRLIYVHRNATSSEIEARICQSDKLPQSTQYLSLSHCWGQTTFLTTTRENISEFELSLPVDRLSLTFQDALFTTIALGFEYIWIDSLCIIQNDTDDWNQASKLMGEVYKHASCNITAAGFRDGVEGFMPRQRRHDPTPVVVTVDWKDAKEAQLRGCHGNTYLFVRRSPWEEITKTPLFERAWVLQEQLLVRSLSDSRTIRNH